MKKLLSIFLALILSFACFSAMLGVSAELEEGAPFTAYDGKYALKIEKYTDDIKETASPKINLSGLNGLKYPDGKFEIFVSVTYRLGGENLSDNGIKPILRLFYNDKYYSQDYTLSEKVTVTSDKWTTVSGVVDASEIKSLDEDNSFYAAALLFHGVGSREVLSDLYIDEVKVEQVSEDGTHNTIISEGFEGLYDSSVTFVKNKIEGDNGFKAAIDFVRLGEATENISAVAADAQTVYEGSRALRIYRYNRFWDTNLCFDFWDGKIHQQELDSIDFTVSVAYYNYGDKPMKLNAWLYYCYNDESFKDPVPFEGEVTGLKGDWVEYTGTVKVDLDSSKKLAITRIILGEDMKKSDATTAYDYAINR